MNRKREIPEISPKIKKYILNRDNNCCQKCGSESDLEIHHIQPIYLNGINDINNLIVLCSYCHKHCPDDYKKFIRYMNVPTKISIYKTRDIVKSYHKYLLFFWSELKYAITSEKMNHSFVIEDYLKLFYEEVNKNYKKTFYYKKKVPFYVFDNLYLKDSIDFVFGKLYNHKEY
jgi:hypothetical protein